MTKALKGNTKHKVLNPKQIQSTNDQMTKTVRIELFALRFWSEATLGFSASARDETCRRAPFGSEPQGRRHVESLPSTSSGPEFIEGGRVD